MVKVISALFIAGSLFGLYLSLSGAPARVHIAEGIGLLVAFVLPALLVGSLDDIRRRWLPLVLLTVLGFIVREWLVSLAVAKYEFLMAGPAVLLVGLLFVAGLLTLHGFIVGLFGAHKTAL